MKHQIVSEAGVTPLLHCNPESQQHCSLLSPACRQMQRSFIEGVVAVQPDRLGDEETCHHEMSACVQRRYVIRKEVRIQDL